MATASRWLANALEPRDDCDVQPAALVAADSWLVTDGRVRGLDLHRQRFVETVPPSHADPAAGLDLDAFWAAAIAELPTEGDWFPRVEARTQLGAPQLLFRLRPAPELSRTVVLATHRGRDPRTEPYRKGPDLEAMLRLRTEAQAVGAGEAVLLDEGGHVAEGSTTCLMWWRGATLCLPADDIPRIDSVTVRSVLALATALGVDVQPEHASLAELDGREIWALNALHGIRLVTRWVDGPEVAAEPGRLELWRARLDALRRPLPAVGAA
jgi:branched-subunit amino acid aminotransferase/4-amino-4-deoxychorismate lyase